MANCDGCGAIDVTPARAPYGDGHAIAGSVPDLCGPLADDERALIVKALRATAALGGRLAAIMPAEEIVPTMDLAGDIQKWANAIEALAAKGEG